MLWKFLAPFIWIKENSQTSLNNWFLSATLVNIFGYCFHCAFLDCIRSLKHMKQIMRFSWNWQLFWSLKTVFEWSILKMKRFVFSVHLRRLRVCNKIYSNHLNFILINNVHSKWTKKYRWHKRFSPFIFYQSRTIYTDKKWVKIPYTTLNLSDIAILFGKWDKNWNIIRLHLHK